MMVGQAPSGAKSAPHKMARARLIYYRYMKCSSFILPEMVEASCRAPQAQAYRLP